MKKIIIFAAMLVGSVIFIAPGYAGRLVPDKPQAAPAQPQKTSQAATTTQTSPQAAVVQRPVGSEMVNGVVVSVNASMNQVVIRDDKTNQQRTLTGSARDIASLKQGDMVRARVKAGTDWAESIRGNMPKADTRRVGY